MESCSERSGRVDSGSPRGRASHPKLRRFHTFLTPKCERRGAGGGLDPFFGAAVHCPCCLCLTLGRRERLPDVSRGFRVPTDLDTNPSLALCSGFVMFIKTQLVVAIRAFTRHIRRTQQIWCFHVAMNDAFHVWQDDPVASRGWLNFVALREYRCDGNGHHVTCCQCRSNTMSSRPSLRTWYLSKKLHAPSLATHAQHCSDHLCR